MKLQNIFCFWQKLLQFFFAQFILIIFLFLLYFRSFNHFPRSANFYLQSNYFFIELFKNKFLIISSALVLRAVASTSGSIESTRRTEEIFLCVYSDFFLPACTWESGERENGRERAFFTLIFSLSFSFWPLPRKFPRCTIIILSSALPH